MQDIVTTPQDAARANKCNLYLHVNQVLVQLVGLHVKVESVFKRKIRVENGDDLHKNAQSCLGVATFSPHPVSLMACPHERCRDADVKEILGAEQLKIVLLNAKGRRNKEKEIFYLFYF